MRAGMGDLIYKDETFKIIGFCMEVHRELGKGMTKLSTKTRWRLNAGEAVCLIRGSASTKSPTKMSFCPIFISPTSLCSTKFYLKTKLRTID